jgi:hypothetical protein
VKKLPPSQRVRLRRQARLATYPGRGIYFGYNSTGYTGDEGEGKGGPPLRAPILVPAETTLAPTSAVVVAEAEAVVVEEPKPKRRKVNDLA